jgi:hypothetical protein
MSENSETNQQIIAIAKKIEDSLYSINPYFNIIKNLEGTTKCHFHIELKPNSFFGDPKSWEFTIKENNSLVGNYIQFLRTTNGILEVNVEQVEKEVNEFYDECKEKEKEFLLFIREINHFLFDNGFTIKSKPSYSKSLYYEINYTYKNNTINLDLRISDHEPNHSRTEIKKPDFDIIYNEDDNTFHIDYAKNVYNNFDIFIKVQDNFKNEIVEVRIKEPDFQSSVWVPRARLPKNTKK